MNRSFKSGTVGVEKQVEAIKDLDREGTITTGLIHKEDMYKLPIDTHKIKCLGKKRKQKQKAKGNKIKNRRRKVIKSDGMVKNYLKEKLKGIRIRKYELDEAIQKANEVFNHSTKSSAIDELVNELTRRVGLRINQ